MSHDVLTTLRAKIAEREAALAVIEAELEHLNASLAIFERDMPSPGRKSGSSKTLRNAIYDVLKEHGNWMHRNRIYDELVKRGVEIPGKDPIRNVGAHLSADTRFVGSGERDGRWRLKSQGKWGATPPADAVTNHQQDPGNTDTDLQQNGHRHPIPLTLS